MSKPLLPEHYMNQCSFNAMTLFILVSWATIYSHFLRTVKDFSIRTLASRTERVVVSYEEYCLFSVMLELWGASWWSSWTHEEPSCLCPMCLWTFLLGHTMNLCCFRRAPPKWHFCRLKGGLKSVIGLTWRNMTYCAHHEWSGCLFRDEAGAVYFGFSTHYLTKQAELWSCAIDAGWSFKRQKVSFVLFFLFPFFLVNHCTVVAVITPET